MKQVFMCIGNADANSDVGAVNVSKVSFYEIAKTTGIEDGYTLEAILDIMFAKKCIRRLHSRNQGWYYINTETMSPEYFKKEKNE